MNNKADSGRIGWVDVAKGLGMLAIILGHIKIGSLTWWLFTFHVPLFFFLSGYCFNGNRSFPDFLRRKIKGIVVPYFCLGLPVVICFAAGGYLMGDLISERFGYDISITGMKDVLNLILQFIVQKRMWTFWFLAALFWLSILFYFCIRYIHDDVALCALSCIFAACVMLYYRLGGGALPWNIDVCFEAFPFMFGGYYYRKKQKNVEAYLSRHRVLDKILIFTFLAGNLAVGYLSYYFSSHIFEIYTINNGLPALSYVSAFYGIGFIVLLSQKIKLRPLQRPVQYIGKNSMIFLTWHQIIMIPLASFILDFVHFSSETAASAGIFAVIMYKILQLLLILLLCAGCNEILSRTKLRFMLGR